MSVLTLKIHTAMRSVWGGADFLHNLCSNRVSSWPCLILITFRNLQTSTRKGLLSGGWPYHCIRTVKLQSLSSSSSPTLLSLPINIVWYDNHFYALGVRGCWKVRIPTLAPTLPIISLPLNFMRHLGCTQMGIARGLRQQPKKEWLGEKAGSMHCMVWDQKQLSGWQMAASCSLTPAIQTTGAAVSWT